MTFKAIGLADIVTADGSAITRQAFLLKNSNGLRDSLDWPKPPPSEWSTDFVNLWVPARKVCFVEPFCVLSSRSLLQAAHLQQWTGASVFDRWKCFYSDEEDQSSAGHSGDGIFMYTLLGASTACQLSRLQLDQPQPRS